ncbi:MAG: ABC transporter permease [Rhodobacteraceae bacterium]|nr:ABC transporter permease [Paracoccaceae bacterium]MCB1366379.1 ABC transporter permease [Paracoccaceae bacterium]
MDFSALSPVALIASLMVASTPILLAAIGELVVEKSGVLNLGVEGMMITGAIFGFAISVETGSPWLGLVAAMVGGAGMALIFGILTQVFLSNQVATGLALTLFGLGFSALVGQSYTGIKPPPFPRLDIPALTEIPYIGKILLNHDYMVYISLGLVLAVWYFLRFTRKGLILRSIGENHTAAHALGYKVIRVRLLAIMFGGACAGLGGAYLSLIRVPQWTEGMTAGAGWIALALVVFASWKPGRLIIGAYLFGGVTILQLNLQAVGVNIPVAYLSMAPYVITILVLVIISSDRKKISLNAPASLGRVFHASN